MLYPLKFKPIHKTKLWGGSKLSRYYRHDAGEIIPYEIPALTVVLLSWWESSLNYQCSCNFYIYNFCKINSFIIKSQIFFTFIPFDFFISVIWCCMWLVRAVSRHVASCCLAFVFICFDIGRHTTCRAGFVKKQPNLFCSALNLHYLCTTKKIE